MKWKWFYNWRTFYKINALVLVMVVFMFVLSFIGFYYYQQAKVAMNDVYANSLMSVKLINEANSNVQKIHNANLELFLTPLNTSKKQNLLIQTTVLKELINESLDLYTDLAKEPFEVAKLANVRDSLQKYSDGWQKVVSLMDSHDEEGAYAYFSDNVTKSLDDINTVLAELVEYSAQNAKSTIVRENFSFARAEKVLFSFPLAAAVLAMTIGFLVARAISRPLEIMLANVYEIAAGNLRVTKIKTESKDEVGQLAQAFNLMTDSLIERRTAELKEANLELLKTNKKLQELDMMKSDFLSTVSHELRTPLTSVLGFAKITQKRLEDVIFPLVKSSDRKVERATRQVKDNIEIIVSEGERLTSLINDVLDLAKMDAGRTEWNIENICVTEVIDRATAATMSLFEQNRLILIKDVEEDLPCVIGDKDKLIQAVINLISNAVKFTGEGSVTCRARKTGAEITISVIDTGIGITNEDQEKVFEKFKQVGDTLTDKPKGTGLGLSICKQIIEHHGGKIWVESKRGDGSNFSFTLPAEGEPYTAGNKIDVDTLVNRLKDCVLPLASIDGKRKNSILVADDDANIRALLRQELEAGGYFVREVKDGLEVINEVKEEEPGLIILDVMMPGMSGFDVAAVLKNDPETMNIPIVILSVVEDKERSYQIGIDRYFTKPVDTEELLKEVGLLISGENQVGWGSVRREES
jgi:signal transduction histidine kinase/CheY-like chemotaxis protein